MRGFCALSHNQRRKFASPKAEYIQKGMVPRVIGEQNPFAGLHTRDELEFILSEIDPYELFDQSQDNAELVDSSAKVTCAGCKLEIKPSEPRYRDWSSPKSVVWVHNNCRS